MRSSVVRLNPASASSPPDVESKIMSSPQWKPLRSSSVCGPSIEMHAVSGNLICRLSWAKASFLSPNPCSRISTFVGGSSLGAWRTCQRRFDVSRRGDARSRQLCITIGPARRSSVSPLFPTAPRTPYGSRRMQLFLEVGGGKRQQAPSEQEMNSLTWHDRQFEILREISSSWQSPRHGGGQTRPCACELSHWTK